MRIKRMCAPPFFTTDTECRQEWVMLVLSRKCGERIRIGEDIVLTVLRIEGAQVRLGIEAPRSISVFRQELLDRMSSETHDDGAHTSEE